MTTQKTKAPKIATGTKARKLTRTEAAAQALRELNSKTTVAELARKADGLLAAAGAKSNLKAVQAEVERLIEAAEALGLLTVTRPTDVFVERAQPVAQAKAS